MNFNQMLVLGIETSCDDTALALVEGTKVLSSLRIAQKDHGIWGGVVPELAARGHQKVSQDLFDQIFCSSGKSWTDIDLIAVTQGPGLQPSLLCGTTLGSFWSLLEKKPLIGVHHILGHILSVHLERSPEEIRLPALVLTVSGGHTELHVRDKNDSITRLGQTLDDAAGEAFDKLAKMLHLGYPGGPLVGKEALEGDPLAFKLPLALLSKTSLDFSFSGVKAAARRIIEKQFPAFLEKKEGEIELSREFKKFRSDLCASFQYTVFLILKKRLERALVQHPEIKQVHFVGGVSANKFLQENLRTYLESLGINLLCPTSLEYCTDNAAMIAFAGEWMTERSLGKARVQFLEPLSRWSLQDFLKGD